MEKFEPEQKDTEESVYDDGYNEEPDNIDEDDNDDDLNDDPNLNTFDNNLKDLTMNTNHSIQSPHLLISNLALRYFWNLYFGSNAYVKWYHFEMKLQEHLSTGNDTEQAIINNATNEFPIPPYGYGLNKYEMIVLFGERKGGHNLLQSLKYCLDLEKMDVISVYQLVILVRNIAVTMSLKHLLFYLSHLGGKIILPPSSYSHTHSNSLMQQIEQAYNKAVAAEIENIVDSEG